MLGSSFVIGGVALIVIFAPNQSCPLTAGRFSYLLAQPGAILLLVFIGLVLVALCAHVVPRYAERHVLIPISCASLLGSLTVLASKAVSTFAVQVRAALSRAVRPAVRPAVLPCALPPSLDRRRVHTVCADPRAH